MPSSQQQEKKKLKLYKKQNNTIQIQVKKLTENIPGAAKILDILGKGFKLTILNMLRRLKEMMYKDLKEIKRMIYEQIGNINNKDKNYRNKPNGNSGAENCSSQNFHLERFNGRF